MVLLSWGRAGHGALIRWRQRRTFRQHLKRDPQPGLPSDSLSKVRQERWGVYTRVRDKTPSPRWSLQSLLLKNVDSRYGTRALVIHLSSPGITFQADYHLRIQLWIVTPCPVL